MVLLLSPAAFDIRNGYKPNAMFQIDVFPFGLKQLPDPAQRSQADAKRKLGL